MIKTREIIKKLSLTLIKIYLIDKIKLKEFFKNHQIIISFKETNKTAKNKVLKIEN